MAKVWFEKCNCGKKEYVHGYLVAAFGHLETPMFCKAQVKSVLSQLVLKGALTKEESDATLATAECLPEEMPEEIARHLQVAQEKAEDELDERTALEAAAAVYEAASEGGDQDILRAAGKRLGSLLEKVLGVSPCDEDGNLLADDDDLDWEE